jgi:hypothetical protein
MADARDNQTPDKPAEGFSVDLPGIRIRISQPTLKLLLQYGGTSWRWIVYAVAAGIFCYSIGYTWQAIR